MPNESLVFDVSEANFQEEVVDRSHETPVVIDFWAPWCGPCRALGPFLESAAQKSAGKFVLAKVNVDENQKLAVQFSVQGIPAVFAMRDGKIVDSFTGVLPEQKLTEWLAKLQPSEVEQLVAEAKKLLVADPASAEEKLRQALANDPAAHQAKLTLAQLMFSTGNVAAAKELLDELEARGFMEPDAETLRAEIELTERAEMAGDIEQLRATVESSPDDETKKVELAYALFAAGDHEDALKTALAIVERDRQGSGEQAKEAMVTMFRVLGEQNDLTSTYRRQLSMALY
ncbi:MAG: thioredoxin [Pirellulales bacterium]|nr:thioredoxin [Pirellulales bacterium]